MERKFSNVGHVINMFIMHINALKEKINLKEDSDQEDLEIAGMLMKKKKRMNLIIAKEKMNLDL